MCLQYDKTPLLYLEIGRHGGGHQGASAQGKFKEREVSKRVSSSKEMDLANVGAQPIGDESLKVFIAHKCST